MENLLFINHNMGMIVIFGKNDGNCRFYIIAYEYYILHKHLRVTGSYNRGIIGSMVDANYFCLDVFAVIILLWVRM